MVLLDVHGTDVSHKELAIVDLKGSLVWTNDSFGHRAMNVKVQRWKEHDYITFWAGDKDDHGRFYVLDTGFNLAHIVSAVGDNVSGDLHEFKITADDTALLVIFQPTPVDLGSTHMSQGVSDKNCQLRSGRR